MVHRSNKAAGKHMLRLRFRLRKDRRRTTTTELARSIIADGADDLIECRKLL